MLSKADTILISAKDKKNMTQKCVIFFVVVLLFLCVFDGIILLCASKSFQGQRCPKGQGWKDKR